jgi:purine-nucleoside phosphorylase
MSEKIKQTVEFIRSKTDFIPEIGIILGSGMGELFDDMEIQCSIDYKSIPNFPVTTVEGHNGRLIFGVLSGKNVVVMSGRFHFYEGYKMDEIALPIRVMKMLGIKILLQTNAAGGLNPDYKVGDLMIFKDHINLIPTNPLIGMNDNSLGPGFLDMSEAYDKTLISLAENIAKDLNISYHVGTFVALSGPMFETPAEQKYLRIIGADAVAMSTVPEVIAARHLDIKCFAVSLITNISSGSNPVETPHEEVLRVAREAGKNVGMLLNKLIEKIKS